MKVASSTTWALVRMRKPCDVFTIAPEPVEDSAPSVCHGCS
jgi:hypothetical protein